MLVMKMLPAIVENNMENFGAALTGIQVLVGKSFARYQRGAYHSREVEDLVMFLLENGACGSGQSSWGPTVYGVVEGMKKCRRLRDDTEKFMNEKGVGGKVYCATPNNRGALIKSAPT
jgi:beta-ribofuranosylaminobenzene 5'-phosphate synthase